MLDRPLRRIALAAMLSLLLHALMLELPHVSPPPPVLQPPPLTARLIVLPKPKHKPPAPTRHIKQHHKRATPQQPAKAPPSRPVITTSPRAQPDNAKQPALPSASTDSGSLIAGTADTDAKPDVPPLPQQAVLVFAAYRGASDLYVGDMRHVLKIGNGHYTIQADTRTVGLARLFKSYDLKQTSRGLLTRNGNLQPLQYTESRTDDEGTRTSGSRFDWENHRTSFSDGHSEPLPAGSQDFLSFLYQLSQTLLDKGTVPVEISNGKKLERYQLDIIGQEEIVTPMGKQPALHLSKRHAAGEEGLDIWLGLNYRLLPIKFRQIDRTGKTAGELTIKEIRVKDK